MGVSYMSNYEGEEIIMVPVPKSRLAAVYAALNPEAKQAVAAQSEETVEYPRQPALTASMVSRLESELDSTAVRGLIDRLAEQAPKSLTFSEAVQVTGVEFTVLRAQLGSLSRISRRLFGDAIWPMEVRSPGGGEAVYSMDPKAAKWWLEAAKRRQ
jgi:hypothetical protein